MFDTANIDTNSKTYKHFKIKISLYLLDAQYKYTSLKSFMIYFGLSFKVL